MIRLIKLIFPISLLLILISCKNDTEKYPSVRALLDRVLPSHSKAFVIDSIASTNDNDIFELESIDGKIVVRASSPSSACYAINYYLQNFCHCQVSRTGMQLNMPETLPVLPQKIQKVSPYKYRYFLNYCTFNYTMSWWGWEEWQRELDWMALHGINLALAMNGYEAVWQNTLTKFGFNSSEIKAFIPGPAYQAWWLMGNLEGWGGPVSQQWIDNRSELQKKIVNRMRELGIEPVMQGFYGMIPTKLKEKYPTHAITNTGMWNGFQRPDMLDPSDTLFSEMANVFYNEQEKLYGKAFFYGGDPFHEFETPTNSDLMVAAKGIQKAMLSINPKSTWLLQAWHENPDDKLIAGTSETNTLIVDLACEVVPLYRKRKSFNNRDFILSFITNYGDHVGHNTNLDTLEKVVFDALDSKYAPHLKGIGMAMEGASNMPLNYEFLFDMAWNTQSGNTLEWLNKYAHARYGMLNDNMLDAYKLLHQTVYSSRVDDAYGFLLCRLPGQYWLDFFSRKDNSDYLSYDLEKFDRAVKLFSSCADEYKTSDSWRYDLVDLTRQAFTPRITRIMLEMNKAKTIVEFDSLAIQLKLMVNDLDKLLSTRKEFMLGTWLKSSRDAALTPKEKRLYEWNARTLITIWGNEKTINSIGNYSWRIWSGLLIDYYLPAWEKFFNYKRSILTGKVISKPDEASFYSFGSDWTRQTKIYPFEPTEDAVEVALKMIKKYQIGKSVSEK